ncbi:hypothetical protein Tco_0818753 [Tanacetum coccineum]
MSSSAIPVPTDSLEESVGSSASLITLSDTDIEATTLPDVLPIAPEAEAIVVASPTGISPFLSEDNSVPDTKSEPLEDSSQEDALEPPEAIVARWRAAVMARSSSSSSSTSTPPTSLQIVPAVPRLPCRSAILVLPGQDPFWSTLPCPP